MNSLASAVDSQFPRQEREYVSACHLAAENIGWSGDRPALDNGFILSFFKEEVN